MLHNSYSHSISTFSRSFIVTATIWVLTGIISPPKFEYGFRLMYSFEFNNHAIAAFVGVIWILNCWVIVFTVTLMILHIKLYRINFTAYEYLLFQKCKKERMKQLKDGTITKEQFDEENNNIIKDVQILK